MLQVMTRIKGDASPIDIALTTAATGAYFDPTPYTWTLAVKATADETSTYLLAPTAGTVVTDPLAATQKIVRFDPGSVLLLAIGIGTSTAEVTGTLTGTVIYREQFHLAIGGRVQTT